MSAVEHSFCLGWVFSESMHSRRLCRERLCFHFLICAGRGVFVSLFIVLGGSRMWCLFGH